MTDPIQPSAPQGFTVDVNDPIIKPVVTAVALAIVGACGFFIKQGLITSDQATALATVGAPIVIGLGVALWRMIVAHQTGKKLVTVATDPTVSDSIAKLK